MDINKVAKDSKNTGKFVNSNQAIKNSVGGEVNYWASEKVLKAKNSKN